MSTATGLDGTRVLVTGACGFVGTTLVSTLLARGADVVALDLPGAAWDRMPPAVHQVRADLLDPVSLVGVADGCAIVYHLAARTDLDGRTPADYAVNSTGTRNLLEALPADVGRVVHYSTQLVVGLFDEARFIDESEPYRTRTPYGESKVASEDIVRAVAGERDLAWTIVRPTSVYGPWGGSPYREFFATVRQGRYLHVGRAANLVSLVHVQNLVDLTLLLSVHPGAAGEVFFGTDFHPYTMREVVDTASAHYGVRIRTAPVLLLIVAAYLLGILKLVGVPVPLYPFRLRNMRMTYCYDVSKSVRLGYDPRFGLADGIEDALTWYDAHPDFDPATS
ncbi:MAG: NAD-dependent epimerase/dehydratase [Marmoricola sp.]|nr:NAD-dependent epimerase/dehydratase [Marmoricola sp.]